MWMSRSLPAGSPPRWSAAEMPKLVSHVLNIEDYNLESLNAEECVSLQYVWETLNDPKYQLTKGSHFVFSVDGANFVITYDSASNSVIPEEVVRNVDADKRVIKSLSPETVVRREVAYVFVQNIVLAMEATEELVKAPQEKVDYVLAFASMVFLWAACMKECISSIGYGRVLPGGVRPPGGVRRTGTPSPVLKRLMEKFPPFSMVVLNWRDPPAVNCMGRRCAPSSAAATGPPVSTVSLSCPIAGRHRPAIPNTARH